MKKFIKLCSIELKLVVREFSSILFSVLLPVGLMGLLGALYQTSEAINQAVPAVITIGLCATGLMGIPITVSSYREKKLLRRFQVTPTSPMLLLMVQFVVNMIIALCSTVLVIITGVVFGYQLKGSLISFISVYFIVMFSIYTLGFLIASISKNVQMSNLLATVIYFPMFFLSGATIPYDLLPKPLQYVTQVMPLTHGIKVLKGISRGENVFNYTLPLIILIIAGLLCIMISVKVFKYDYE